MTARKPRPNPLHIALCAALLAGVSWAAPPVPSSQPHGLMVWPQGAGSPAFELVDAEGVPRTLRDYRGQVVVIFFGFLHCPDACPAGLFKLARVMKQLGQVAAHVQVLFITLDPERDTPASLKSYVSAFDPRFIGLTGTSAQIDQAASGFNVQYARVPLGNDYTIDHSTAIFLFDGAGRLRRIGATNSPVADFVHDITELVAKRP
ncbi:MAG TPA: SCO family protein [Steroidobacteraceae bacterium]|nr:SCO family protein [Steroidobacteraceae bacterium]